MSMRKKRRLLVRGLKLIQWCENKVEHLLIKMENGHDKIIEYINKETPFSKVQKNLDYQVFLKSREQGREILNSRYTLDQLQSEGYLLKSEMGEGFFWELIEKTRKENEVNLQNRTMLSELSKLSPKEIIGFQRTMNRLFEQLGNPNRYIHNTDWNSTDQKYPENVKYLIISLGKENYYEIKKLPHFLYNLSGYNWEINNLEPYSDINCADDAFFKKTGMNIKRFTNTFNRLSELEENHKQKMNMNKEL